MLSRHRPKSPLPRSTRHLGDSVTSPRVPLVSAPNARFSSMSLTTSDLAYSYTTVLPTSKFPTNRADRVTKTIDATCKAWTLTSCKGNIAQRESMFDRADNRADLDGGDCKPITSEGGKPYYPCGLIANSVFNGEHLPDTADDRHLPLGSPRERTKYVLTRWS